MPGSSNNRSLDDVLNDCMRRRIAGERLSDTQVLAEHPDLSLELVPALQVLALVEVAERRAGGAPALTCSPMGTEPTDLPADSIPGYKLISEIRRGGQSVVFRALQIATGRDVAIKVRREDLLSRQHDRDRFEREIRILGRLRHPNIVTIHDSGTAGSCAFFVMDFIHGDPLNSFASQRHLTVRQIFVLFTEVCEAVHAAHLLGVIHRDLKPDNILVDQDGRPHVLDFGLAKLTDADDEGLPSQNLTQTDQFIGTLRWASPEQVDGRGCTIDLRTDVYSLGVILYQVLTKRFPYGSESPMAKVAREIVEAPPIRLRSARPELDDEVETIVLRCLAKEREQRYQSVAALALDIRRYLAGEPLVARQDRALHVLRKALRRHRLVTVLVTALLLLGVGSIFGLWSLYSSQRRERAHAEQEARTSAVVVDFLQDIFGASDPLRHAVPGIAFRQRLDEASSKLVGGAFRGQPEIEMRLNRIVGNAYSSLSAYAQAEGHLRAALESSRTLGRPQDISVDLGDWALLLKRKGDYEGSERAYREALQIYRRFRNSDDAATALLLNNLAQLLRSKGRFVEAEPVYREALDIRKRLLGPRHPDVAVTLHNLGALLIDAGRITDAEPLIREAIEILTEHGDVESVQAGLCRGSLALVLMGQNKVTQSIALSQEALEILRRRLPDPHPDVAATLANLGLANQRGGRRADAERTYRESVAMYERLVDAESSAIATPLTGLSALLRELGRAQEAEPLARRAVAACEFLGAGARKSNALRELGYTLQTLNRPADAEVVVDELVSARRKTADENPLDLAGDLALLGLLQADLHKYDEAILTLREALSIREKNLPRGHWQISSSMSLLGGALAGAQQFEEAERLLLNGYAGIKESRDVQVRRKREAVERIVKFYTDWDSAEPNKGIAVKGDEWRTLLASFPQ